MNINRNLSINNLRASIQEDIGWRPDLIHKRLNLDGTQIIKNTEIREGDNIVIGKKDEQDGDKSRLAKNEATKSDFNYMAAVRRAEEKENETDYKDQEDESEEEVYRDGYEDQEAIKEEEEYTDEDEGHTYKEEED